MPKLIAAEDIDTVVCGLVGAIDVDGGPTDEQLAVLQAIVVHLFERDDLELTSVEPLGPEETAHRLTSANARRRFAELLFTLETCRHPLSDAQVTSCEQYADALGSSPEEVRVLRTAIDEGVARAAADFDRFFSDMVVDRSEPRFRTRNLAAPHLDPELIELVSRFHRLPEGTLGWCLADFYATHGFAVPGSEISPNTYLYFDHDNIHVISGIAPTGIGEIALGGFQLCMDDNPASTFAFFSPLVLHEAGLSAVVDDIVAVGSTLARPYAAELLGSEMARGSRTTGDFAWIDHVELAPYPLDEVRARFNVEPPARPDDGHHIFW
jgi:hypothetical protein